jgi:hypothetical protein
VLNAITQGNVTPLVGGLTPSGASPNGPTRQAVANLAGVLPGIVSNGNINPVRLQAGINAYNDYARALVAEVGPARAIAIAAAGSDQQNLKQTLINLVGSLR